jgi:hypothetical protein
LNCDRFGHLFPEIDKKAPRELDRVRVSSVQPQIDL